MPAIINAKKFNTVIWSMLAGLVLYGILSFHLRKRIGAALQPSCKISQSEIFLMKLATLDCNWVPCIHTRCLDFCHDLGSDCLVEILGLGSKEVWALITWLFYAAFLHLRISRGGTGKNQPGWQLLALPSLCLILSSCNLIIAGLHSYA